MTHSGVQERVHFTVKLQTDSGVPVVEYFNVSLHSDNIFYIKHTVSPTC